MESLFLKLVNMSISASWLVLAVVVLRFVMKKAPKWMTCALWAMVAIRLVFPFSIESAFSLVPDPDPIPPSVITNHTPIVAPADTPVSSDTPVISPGTPMLGTQADAISPASITELAATVWIVGVAVLLIYALVSYLLIRRKVAASLHLRENIYLCDYIESPFILGILRPRIYLPSALDQSQWPHVLAHEQAHLHRRDHWWKPLGFAILCVYWFNPVLWLAYILLCRDIELACDERVIRDMDTRQKQDYTTALLECSMPRYLVAACPLAFGEVGVKERVKSVLNYKKPAFWIILIALILCVAAAVCFLTDPVGSNDITPGVYNIDSTLYQEDLRYDGVPQYVIAPGQYILHNNNLYWDDGTTIIADGQMTPYDLSNRELRDYLRVDSWWKTFFHHVPTISDALWLRQDNGSFFVWFQTTNGETYLARGVEDYGERYDWFDDDTLISHLCRLTKDENAEEKELAWFDATVVKSTTTWITVEPDPGSAERNSSDRIEVSLYWHHSDDRGHATGILGEFQVGDRVRIVYDGQIQETYPARISNTHSVTMLDAPATPYAVISGENQVDPLFVPVNTDISTLSGLPVLKLAQNESGQYQFQLLRDGYPNPGYFRLYDYKTKEEIKNFHYFGSTSGPDWSLLEPGRNYIVVQERDGMICFIASVPYDFGITLTASDVTPTGMTVKCTQSGGNCPGEITYGNPQGYWLRRITDGGGENVPNLDGSAGVTVTTEAYILERNSTVTWNYDWTNRFGTLEPGDYRFDLYFSHGEPLKNDTLPISVYFTIGNSQSTWDFSATVLEVNEGSILVEPLPGTVNHPGTNLIRVTRTLTDSGVYVQDISVGDIVSIRYDGKIAETYPGQINTVYDIQVLPDHPDGPKEPLPQWEISLEVTHATSTEALIVYHINNLGPGEVWTGYDYHLEALTDEGWVHYGYPPEELAWESALLFHTSDHYPLDSQNKEIFVADWSRTADAPLPVGTYYVVLTVDQDVPDNGAVFQFQKYITEPFAITD